MNNATSDGAIYTEEKPWGSFTRFALNEPVTVKIIKVSPGQAFSLQYHNHREECWRIISGDGMITVGNIRSAIVVGSDYQIPPKTNHRIEAGNTAVIFLEVSRGIFDEKDIVRLEDNYGRT